MILEIEKLLKMPTIFKVGPYRFFFWSNEGTESIHVHVERDHMIGKFWIDPVILQESGGFNQQELFKIQKIIDENSEKIKEAWNEYFD